MTLISLIASSLDNEVDSSLRFSSIKVKLKRNAQQKLSENIIREALSHAAMVAELSHIRVGGKQKTAIVVMVSRDAAVIHFFLLLISALLKKSKEFQRKRKENKVVNDYVSITEKSSSSL